MPEYINLVVRSSIAFNYKGNSTWETRLWENLHGNKQSEKGNNSRLHSSVSRLMKTQGPAKVLKTLEGLFCTNEKVIRPLPVKYQLSTQSRKQNRKHTNLTGSPSKRSSRRLPTCPSPQKKLAVAREGCQGPCFIKPLFLSDDASSKILLFEE